MTLGWISSCGLVHQMLTSRSFIESFRFWRSAISTAKLRWCKRLWTLMPRVSMILEEAVTALVLCDLVTRNSSDLTLRHSRCFKHMALDSAWVNQSILIHQCCSVSEDQTSTSTWRMTCSTRYHRAFILTSGPNLAPTTKRREGWVPPLAVTIWIKKPRI